MVAMSLRSRSPSSYPPWCGDRHLSRPAIAGRALPRDQHLLVYAGQVAATLALRDGADRARRLFFLAGIVSLPSFTPDPPVRTLGVWWCAVSAASRPRSIPDDRGDAVIGAHDLIDVCRAASRRSSVDLGGEIRPSNGSARRRVSCRACFVGRQPPAQIAAHSRRDRRRNRTPGLLVAARCSASWAARG